MRRKVSQVRFTSPIELFSKPCNMWLLLPDGGSAPIGRSTMEFDPDTRDLRLFKDGRTLIIPWHNVGWMELEPEPKAKPAVTKGGVGK